MATNRVSSSGDRDHAVRQEFEAPVAVANHIIQVSSSGISPGTTDCTVGQTFQFTGANLSVEIMRDGTDKCKELFGVDQVTVGKTLFHVQPGSEGKTYCVTTNSALCSNTNAASDPHVSCAGDGGGTVGTIKVGTT